MLLIKAYLAKSKIHGIGLFAGQDIKSGTVIYKTSPGLDLELSEEQFKKIDDASKRLIQHYGYQSKENKKWHLAFDNIRFCNHSEKNNLTKSKIYGTDHLIATKNIKKGEELLQNYNEFENLREELQNL